MMSRLLQPGQSRRSDENTMETWIDSHRLYEGRIVSLRTGSVRMDDGTIAFREVVEHPGGVGVVPFHDGRVILIRQYRIAVGCDILEIPAGKLESGDQDTETRGRCELEEETGYRAGQMVSAGSVYASVGYTSELIHLYLAFNLEKVGQRLESDECIDIVEIPLDEAKRLIASNELKDMKTLVALEALFRYLESA